MPISPDIKLWLTATAFSLACNPSTPNIDSLPNPTPIVTSVAGDPPLAPDQSVERRKRGEMLEKLNFDITNLKRIEPSNLRDPEHIARVDKVDLVNYSKNYSVFVDAEQLLKIMKQCGVGGVAESFRFTFVDYIANPAGVKTSQLAQTSQRGSIIYTDISLDMLFSDNEASLQRDFETHPEKRAEGLKSLASMNLSSILVDTLCTWIGIIPLRVIPGTEQQQQVMGLAAQAEAASHSADILSGQALPAVVVEQVVPQLSGNIA